MTVVLTKKFLDTSNLNLIKVQNDVGLNRFTSSRFILLPKMESESGLFLKHGQFLKNYENNDL